VLVAALVVVAAAACGSALEDNARVAPADDSPGPESVVSVAAGRLHGTLAPGHRLFADIPYAAAPVGARRWRAPEPPAPWTGVRDATRPGPRCPQGLAKPPRGAPRTSEDCLSLNVWTPRAAGPARPVLVWLHGGAFLGGAGSDYRAQLLANQGNLVVVTLNYRLGALGWLAHPALAERGQLGNYGLLDQQAALRWVRDNIAAFGGDPTAVTLAGESAGAMSVCDQLASPGAAGLFRAAILQSGPCLEQTTLASAEQVSVAWAARVGCPDGAGAAACLRALPATRLLTSPVFYSLAGVNSPGPVIGDPVLPNNPVDAATAGTTARVPVLIGTNRDEFRFFLAQRAVARNPRPGVPTAATYRQALAETFPGRSDAVQAHYPPSAFGGRVPLAYAAAVTDQAFACPADILAGAYAAQAPVYAYEFDDPAPPPPPGLARSPFPLGAAHSLELQYLFQLGTDPEFTPDQLLLSDRMISYWSRFAATGNPNPPDQPSWPRYDRSDPRVLRLSPTGDQAAADVAAEHQCAFWNPTG
jgi:para-nitrobenzyl esterase